MKRYCLLPIVIIGVLLSLIGCKSSTIVEPIDSDCIGSFDVFAYTRPERGSQLPEDVFPLKPWQIEASIPEISGLNYPYNNFEVGLVRSRVGYDEIWLIPKGIDIPYLTNPDDYNIFIYRTDSKKWNTVSAEVPSTGVVIGKLFLDKNGNVWGQNFWDTRTGIQRPPVLSKYNDKNKAFEFDNKSIDIPAVSTGDGYLPKWPMIHMDSGGIFWIVVSTNFIYSYDPESQDVISRSDISSLSIYASSLGPDGSIFIAKYPNDWNVINVKKGDLYRFSPTDGLIELTPPKGFWPAFGNILVDHTGQLWLDSVGFLDTKGGWHRKYPNPWRYFWEMRVNDDTRWATANVIFESSDGKLWYQQDGTSGRGGLAWYDPNTSSGCWFTTISSRIIEDATGTLWLTANYQLYSLDLHH